MKAWLEIQHNNHRSESLQEASCRHKRGNGEEGRLPGWPCWPWWSWHPISRGPSPRSPAWRRTWCHQRCWPWTRRQACCCCFQPPSSSAARPQDTVVSTVAHDRVADGLQLHHDCHCLLHLEPNAKRFSRPGPHGSANRLREGGREVWHTTWRSHNHHKALFK